MITRIYQKEEGGQWELLSSPKRRVYLAKYSMKRKWSPYTIMSRIYQSIDWQQQKSLSSSHRGHTIKPPHKAKTYSDLLGEDVQTRSQQKTMKTVAQNTQGLNRKRFMKRGIVGMLIARAGQPLLSKYTGYTPSTHEVRRTSISLSQRSQTHSKEKARCQYT